MIARSKASPARRYDAIAMRSPPRAWARASIQPNSFPYSTARHGAAGGGFSVVMLWLLEVLLACYLVAPEWTPGAVDRGKAWGRRHAHRFAVRGLAAISAPLTLKGVIGFVS